MEAWELALAFAGSFVAGYFGSALGLVLGTLRLPLIVVASGSPLAAAGTNIAISAAAAATGGLRHAREGRVDWRVVAWMAPPSVVGAIAGALLADDVPERALYAVIAAVLVWSGIDLALRPIEPKARARLRLRAAAGHGFAIGAIGGAVGVILGTLRMPALVRSVGLDVRRAAGTNLVVGFFLGVAGFATHATASVIEWDILAAGLAGALPGAWLGARVTGVLSENTLRLALGTTLVLIGGVFAAEAVLR
ncbi:MAG: sulfite exporter TauE/SafE family protein [Actinobacteria bacterium]|nr:sulfite exporter TauE/SafE family protein [Actinomycetota bacterium]